MAHLSAVLRHLQRQRDQAARSLACIDAAITALTGHAGRPAAAGVRRRLSAAARRRIAAAQKARWAQWRKAKKG